MKLLLRILFFVLTIFQTNICEAKVFVFGEVFTQIRFIENAIENKNEVTINSGNDIAITCKSESDLVDYRNWDIGVEAVAAKTGSTFFEGASYSSKVVKQMGKVDDIFHAFPKSVDGFATKFGQWSTKVGADGKTYQWLKMNGSYGGKTGTFEYIKDANGIINHRFFNVPKVP